MLHAQSEQIPERTQIRQFTNEGLDHCSRYTSLNKSKMSGENKGE